MAGPPNPGQYLRISYDEETNTKVQDFTSEVAAVPGNIFHHLGVLNYLLPDILGASRYRSSQPYHWSPRYHGTQHELLFVIDGAGTFHIGGSDYAVSAGDVCLIKPHDVHYYTRDSDFECITFHYSFKHLRQTLGRVTIEVPEDKADPFFQFLMESYPSISLIRIVGGSEIIPRVHSLYREYRTPGAGGKFMVSLSFLEIMILLARNYLFSRDQSGLSAEQVSTRDRMLVNQITTHIKKHYAEQISPGSVFKNYYLHPDYCRSLFKKITGVSVREYLLRTRLEAARKRIQETGDTIKTIAASVGIENQYYFMRVFKKRYGCTPGSLRKTVSY